MNSKIDELTEDKAKQLDTKKELQKLLDKASKSEEKEIKRDMQKVDERLEQDNRSIVDYEDTRDEMQNELDGLR